MEATLHFNLDNAEDRERFDMCLRIDDMKDILKLISDKLESEPETEGRKEVKKILDDVLKKSPVN